MRIWQWLLVGCVLSTGVVQADMLKLKNGSTVEGKIVEQSADNVKVDIGGVTLTYYTDEVASVEKSELPAASEIPAAAPVMTAPEAAVSMPSAAETRSTDLLDTLTKGQLIRKFVAIYGVKENMQANFDQMSATLNPEQAKDFRMAIQVDDIVEQLLPIYDRRFTDADLKAYIRFYGSEEGKKLVQSLPLLMKDSVDVSMKYLDLHLPDSLKQAK
ncbi:MAG: DUF2059 domain-containing protein [Candidatus Omnitrophota bacterium]